jgi:hypothetical protein
MPETVAPVCAKTDAASVKDNQNVKNKLLLIFIFPPRFCPPQNERFRTRRQGFLTRNDFGPLIFDL